MLSGWLTLLMMCPSQAEAFQATGIEEPQSATTPSSCHPLSPRQRRTTSQHSSLSQQHNHLGQRGSRDPAIRPVSTQAPYQPQDESHTGSAFLILVLTLALAALIFRRIYLAHDYKFDYEMWLYTKRPTFSPGQSLLPPPLPNNSQLKSKQNQDNSWPPCRVLHSHITPSGYVLVSMIFFFSLLSLRLSQVPEALLFIFILVAIHNVPQGT